MKSTIILRKLNMSKFIFRAFGETETEKQDKLHGQMLEALANYVLTLDNKETVDRALVVFHRRFVAQTYCEKGADLRVQFTDQVREAWVGANL